MNKRAGTHGSLWGKIQLTPELVGWCLQGEESISVWRCSVSQHQLWAWGASAQTVLHVRTPGGLNINGAIWDTLVPRQKSKKQLLPCYVISVSHLTLVWKPSQWTDFEVCPTDSSYSFFVLTACFHTLVQLCTPFCCGACVWAVMSTHVDQRALVLWRWLLAVAL